MIVIQKICHVPAHWPHWWHVYCWLLDTCHLYHSFGQNLGCNAMMVSHVSIIRSPALWENDRIQILSSEQRLLLVQRVQRSLSFCTIIVPDEMLSRGLERMDPVVKPSSFSDWHAATADLFALFTGHLTFKPIFSQMEKYSPARASFGGLLLLPKLWSAFWHLINCIG